MVHETRSEDDDLDDHDRDRASDMEERPIYPALVPVSSETPGKEEAKPLEVED
jgi:hypothetical protein